MSENSKNSVEGSDLSEDQSFPADEAPTVVTGEVDMADLDFDEQVEFNLEKALGEFQQPDQRETIPAPAIPVSTMTDLSESEIPVTVSFSPSSTPAMAPPAMTDLPPPEFIINRDPSLLRPGSYSLTENGAISISPAPVEDGETMWPPPPDYNPKELTQKTPDPLTAETLEITRVYGRMELFAKFTETRDFKRYRKDMDRFLAISKTDPKKVNTLKKPTLWTAFKKWLKKQERKLNSAQK